MKRPFHNVTNALGQVTRNAYDPQGRLIATWGNTYPVAYQYDPSGRMTAMATTRDGAVDFAALAAELANGASLTSIGSIWSLDLTQWQYHEPTGLLTNKLYADGKGTSYTYTPDGKLATRTWARGVTTTYTYTNGSSLASISYSDDTPSVTFGYDRLGRQTSAIVDGVSTNLYSYDALTQALSTEIQNGSTITRTTDALGRNIGFSIGSDYVVEYGYDTYGRFTSVASSTQSTQSTPSTQSMYTYSYLPGTDLLSGYTAGDFTRTVSYEPYRNLITSVENKHGSTIISQYDYTNDPLGRRTAIARSGTAFGDMPVRDAYGYNHRSEVTSARRTLAGNPSQEIRGFSYDYAYDPIGNRISSTEYDPDNTPLISTYTANALNQYEQRTVPGYAGVRGFATNTATVTVNGNPTWRLDDYDYFYGGDDADNSTTAIMKELAIIAAHSNQYAAATGHVFVAHTPEEFTYDDDGNLTQDGRWQYTWNGENRLIKAIELIAPTNRQPYEVNYAYDHRGRMVWKSVAPTTSPPLKTIQYLWDDYNIIAEVECRESGVTTTYNTWGLDLSGTHQGAGGVGGLLAVYSPLPLGEGQGEGEGGLALPCYDGNGNITEYITTNGTITAHYEYSPFGELVVQSGDLADSFTHRFSTKPWCEVTWLSEYEYRKCSPSMGRWLSRDPIGEEGFKIMASYPKTGVEELLVFLSQLLATASSINPTAANVLRSTFYSLQEKKNFYDGIEPAYNFVHNAPLNMIDAFGLKWWWPPDWLKPGKEQCCSDEDSDQSKKALVDLLTTAGSMTPKIGGLIKLVGKSKACMGIPGPCTSWAKDITSWDHCMECCHNVTGVVLPAGAPPNYCTVMCQPLYKYMFPPYN